MDDMNAFEHQVAGEFVRRAGPVRPVDAAAIITAITATQSPKWRFQTMFSATKFVIAGAIVALFGGGVLLTGIQPTVPADESVVAATATAVPSPLTVLPNGVPGPVQEVDWQPVEDASVFGRGEVWDVAIGPSGVTVIVGHRLDPDGSGADHAQIWSSVDGVQWQTNALPEAIDAVVARVVSTSDGFVAIGTATRPRGEKPPRLDGLIWTSENGVDWSEPVVIRGAQLDDIDSNEDVLVIAGGLASTRGIPTSFSIHVTPTVWTSRAGGPWQAAAVGGKSLGRSSVAISADGAYLVGDYAGWLRRSPDGKRFVAAAIPEGRNGWGSGLMEGGPDGFTLEENRNGKIVLWASRDGRAWRRSGTLPGSYLRSVSTALAKSGVVPTELVPEDGGPALPVLEILRADGSWCAVSATTPFAAVADLDPMLRARLYAMASSEDGKLVLVGFRLSAEPSESAPGDLTDVPIVWQATGSTCVQ
jgi:hypothetical protein